MRTQTFAEEKVTANEFFLEQRAEQGAYRDKGWRREGKLQHGQNEREVKNPMLKRQEAEDAEDTGDENVLP